MNSCSKSTHASQAVSTELAWVLSAILLIAASQVIIFVVASRHGFDLTDEAFYLMNYLYWKESSIFSLFGAYLEIPFRLGGYSIWTIRIFGFLLIAFGGFWFASELFISIDALSRRQTEDWGGGAAAIAAAMAAWSFYGAFPGPYTPGYNLLTLCCALISLAISLRIGRMLFRSEPRYIGIVAFALGFIASVGILNKFTAGSLILCLDIAILLTFGWRKTDGRCALSIALFIIFGLLSNSLIFLAADEGTINRLKNGISIQWATLPRNPLAELVSFALFDFPKAVIQTARILLWPTVLGLFAMIVARKSSRNSLWNSVAITVFVVGAMLDTYIKDNRFHRIVLITFIAGLLTMAAMLMRHRRPLFHVPVNRKAIIGIVILLTPFAYSFGTNNIIIWHMGMAAIFPSAVAISNIRSLWVEKFINRWAFIICICVFAALPAEIGVRQWMQAKYTYRLGAPLADQTASLESMLIPTDLQIEPRVARGINDFLGLVRSSGFKAGQSMIDFTGQAPGLLLVAGARPVGAPWLVGGPPFDGDTGARVALDTASKNDIREAWLLTSSDSFARIEAWQDIMREKVGESSHEQVGHISIPDPSSNDKSITIEVTLWRPRVTTWKK